MGNKTCLWCEELFEQEETENNRGIHPRNVLIMGLPTVWDTCEFCRVRVPVGLLDSKKTGITDFGLLRFYLNYLQGEIREILPDNGKDKCDCCDKPSTCANFVFTDNESEEHWMDICRVCSEHLTASYCDWVCSSKKGYSYRNIDIEHHYKMSIGLLEKYLKALLAEKKKAKEEPKVKKDVSDSTTKNVFWFFDTYSDMQNFKGDMRLKGLGDDYHTDYNQSKYQVWCNVKSENYYKALDLGTEHNAKAFGTFAIKGSIFKPENLRNFEFIKDPGLGCCGVCGVAEIGQTGSQNRKDPPTNGKGCNETGPTGVTGGIGATGPTGPTGVTGGIGATGPSKENLEKEVKELRQKNLELSATNRIQADNFTKQYLELEKQDKELKALNERVEEQEKELLEQDEELEKQDEELKALNVLVADRVRELFEQDEELEKQDEIIQKQKALIAKLKNKSNTTKVWALFDPRVEKQQVSDRVRADLLNRVKLTYCHSSKQQAEEMSSLYGIKDFVKIFPIEISVVDE